MSSISNKQNKVSPLTRDMVNKTLEEEFYQKSHSINTFSTCIPSDSTITFKPQPIIIYERIFHHNKSNEFESKSLVGNKNTSSTNICVENLTKTESTIQNDTDSDMHEVSNVIGNDSIDTIKTSPSNTSKSSGWSFSLSDCSRNLHSDFNAKIPTENQHGLEICSKYFQRSTSLSPPAETNSKDNDNRYIPQLHSLTAKFSSSNVNIADQYRQLLSSNSIQSDSNLSLCSTKKTHINTNLPLRYKRESLIKLYG